MTDEFDVIVTGGGYAGENVAAAPSISGAASQWAETIRMASGRGSSAARR